MIELALSLAAAALGSWMVVGGILAASARQRYEFEHLRGGVVEFPDHETARAHERARLWLRLRLLAGFPILLAGLYYTVTGIAAFLAG